MIFIILNFLFNLLLLYFYPIKLNFKYKKISVKKNSIRDLYSCADFLDNMLLYLEAGFDAFHAFEHAAAFTNCPSIKKFAFETMQIYNTGCSFNNALNYCINNNKNFYFNEIIEHIQLSLKLGTSLKLTLTELSHFMKFRCNLKTEEIIAQFPVKMIFPLVFFIFPVIFIILGSSSIQDLLRSLRF
jgi:tight adherence protein C